MEEILFTVFYISIAMASDISLNERGLLNFLDNSDPTNKTEMFFFNRTTTGLRFIRTYDKVYYAFCVLAAAGAICTIIYTCAKCIRKCCSVRLHNDVMTDQIQESGIRNESFVTNADDCPDTVVSGSFTVDSPPDYHTIMHRVSLERSIDNEILERKYYQNNVTVDDDVPPPYDSAIMFEKS